MTRSFFLLIAALLLIPVSVQAEPVKNSLDYTMDDGIMSKEEMEMEAQEMYGLCASNLYQKNYFNCACLAGAFLQEREKVGPLVMQDEIFRKITNSKHVSPSCANTEVIAGRAFSSCISFTRNYARTELDGPLNVEYCTCVANKLANDFTKTPRLSTQYVEVLRYDAMTVCRSPKNREALKAAAAKARADKEIANQNAVPLLPAPGTAPNN